MNDDELDDECNSDDDTTGQPINFPEKPTPSSVRFEYRSSGKLMIPKRKKHKIQGNKSRIKARPHPNGQKRKK